MKKVIFTTLFLLIVAVLAYAYTPDDYVRDKTYFGSGRKRLDPMYLHMEDVANGGAIRGTGVVFYVDSNVANEGDGTSWTRAKDTLDEAINLCVADRGDVIYVAQKHTETFTGADGFDVDVAGVTIIGLGRGEATPTFVFNNGAAEVAISDAGDNATLRNLRFECSVDSVLICLDIEAGADNVTVDGCLFWEVGDASGTDEFDSAIRIGNACVGTTIQNCIFRAEAADAISAIHSDNDTSYTTIQDNFITGDYSSGCINFISVASTDLSILRNILINGDMASADTALNAVAAINCVEATSGVVIENRILSAVATHLLMRVADDMAFVGNLTLDTADDAIGGIRETGSATIAADVDGL